MARLLLRVVDHAMDAQVRKIIVRTSSSSIPPAGSRTASTDTTPCAVRVDELYCYKIKALTPEMVTVCGSAGFVSPATPQSECEHSPREKTAKASEYTLSAVPTERGQPQSDDLSVSC